jgi:hypothetical protein
MVGDLYSPHPSLRDGRLISSSSHGLKPTATFTSSLRDDERAYHPPTTWDVPGEVEPPSLCSPITFQTVILQHEFGTTRISSYGIVVGGSPRIHALA